MPPLVVVGKLPGDQHEHRDGIFRGLEVGIGSEIVRCISESGFELFQQGGIFIGVNTMSGLDMLLIYCSIDHMCGRFSHGENMAEISDFLKRQVRGLRARYNIAPRQVAPVVIQTGTGPELHHFRWGLIPSWAKGEQAGDKMINARSETVLEKPSFRNAFKLRRCLVIADGWYEWTPLLRGKQPWRICPTRGKGVVCFAGLHESWTPPEMNNSVEGSGHSRQTFTILTTEANETLRHLHERMPVVLHRSCWAEWLNPRTPLERVQSLLLPADEADFRAYRVTPQVGRVDFDNPLAHLPLPELDLGI